MSVMRGEEARRLLARTRARQAQSRPRLDEPRVTDTRHARHYRPATTAATPAPIVRPRSRNAADETVATHQPTVKR